MMPIPMSAGEDLHPEATLAMGPDLFMALLLCIVLALACVLCAVLLSRPHKRPTKIAHKGAHSGANRKGPWRTRVDDIVASHAIGTMDRDAAFTALAKVARDYASHVSGSDMSSHTLTDISTAPRNPGNRHGLDLLKQTIAALYPPEFADADMNASARETSVEQAGEWVLRLVGRWRR